MRWGSWLDEYDRQARLIPALLTVLPLVLAAIGLGVQDNKLLITILSVLATVGVPMVVAKQVADRGRVIEASLYMKWGGPPTALMLAPRADGNLDELRRQRRDRLERLSQITLPMSSDSAALDRYQAAVRWLIENTRDHTRFPVVWAELKTYGFERNALALRPLALTCTGLGVLVLGGAAVAGVLGADLPVLTDVMLAVLGLAVGAWWWCVPSEGRVRVAADRYAERLLDASAALT